ncbi:hypothetical protein AWB76_06558 [Caballeronia temeraria]|uniref:Uncharacterized protein n=1 Tax=Caballeronia temeraria TaxID=1777137 RepID=A0A158D7K2_9BURK|nr:hypothetical protein AWB76_06558 [Caballeronia temeraria]
MRVLRRAEPRLRDQIAERLRHTERVGPAIEDRADFSVHHFQRRMIADQMMPVQLHQPASASRFGNDRNLQQRSAGEIEALRAGIEMLRQLSGGVAVRDPDLGDGHGRLAPDHLRGRAESVVDEGGAQDVMPLDDLLQRIEPRIETGAAVERESRGLQIRIALRGQHVMKQNAVLKRSK